MLIAYFLEKLSILEALNFHNCVYLRMTGPFEIESNTSSAKIGLKFGGYVHMGWFACGILDHQK